MKGVSSRLKMAIGKGLCPLRVFFISCIVVGFLYSQLPPRHIALGDWTMYGGSLGHNGYGALKGLLSSWSVKYMLSPGYSEAEPLVGDVDGDGMPELVQILGNVVNIYNGSSGTLENSFSIPYSYPIGGALANISPSPGLEMIIGNRAYTSSGSIIWTASCANEKASPAVAADGLDTLVILRSVGGTLCAVRASNGSTVWTRSVGGNQWGSSPVIGNINSTPELEVVVNGTDGYVRAFRFTDGAVLWSTYVGTYDYTEPNVSLGDINGDCIDEVIAPGGYNIYALNGSDGSVIWSYNVGGYIYGAPSVGDVNGDGLADVIVTKNSGCGGFGGTLYVISSFGTLLWSYGTTLGIPCVHGGGKLILDIDGDNELELILAPYGDGWGDGILRVFKASNGVLEWSQSGTDTEGSAFADVDGDGCAELVLSPTCCTGNLIVLDRPGSGCGYYPYNDTCGVLGYDNPVKVGEERISPLIKAEGKKGGILIKGVGGVRIYGVDGSLIFVGSLNGERFIPLKRGVYYVLVGGERKMVVVK